MWNRKSSAPPGPLSKKEQTTKQGQGRVHVRREFLFTFRTSPDRVDAKASLVMVDGDDLLNVYIEDLCLLVLFESILSVFTGKWEYGPGMKQHYTLRLGHDDNEG